MNSVKRKELTEEKKYLIDEISDLKEEIKGLEENIVDEPDERYWQQRLDESIYELNRLKKKLSIVCKIKKELRDGTKR